MHGRRAGCPETRKKYGRLHLGAWHRERVLDAMQVPASHRQRRETAPLAAIDLRPHQPERHGNPVHRPLRDRRVPLQDAQAVQGRNEPGQQADTGAGVADVNESLRFMQARGAALHVEVSPTALRACAERHHGLERVADVLAVRQPPDPRTSLSPSGNQQRPVRDRLVAWRAEPAPERPSAGRFYDQLFRHTTQARCVAVAQLRLLVIRLRRNSAPLRRVMVRAFVQTPCSPGR